MSRVTHCALIHVASIFSVRTPSNLEIHNISKHLLVILLSKTKSLLVGEQQPMNAFSLLQRTATRSNITLRARHSLTRRIVTMTNGDLNNTAAVRVQGEIITDPAYRNFSLAIPSAQDDPEVRQKYRPFLLEDGKSDQDWIAQLELSTVLKMVDQSGGDRIKVLVLHGSMRKR
jgi:hypothetical protein